MNRIKKAVASLIAAGVFSSFAALPASAYNEYGYAFGESTGFGDEARRHDGLFSGDAVSVLEARFIDGAASFCWNYLVGADGYKLYREDSSSGKYVLAADIAGTVCSYTDHNIESYSDYSYKVRAYKITESGEPIFSKSSDAAFIHTEEVMQIENTAEDTLIEETDDNTSYDSFKTENPTYYEPLSSSCAEETVNSIHLCPKSSFEVVSYRDGYNGWTSYISENDKRILDEFAEEHFTADMTVYDKLKYTADYIHNNVDYAYDSYDEIEDCSYIEAVFVKHTGQCLQYNGALAGFASYLGLDVRLISGNRGTGKDNKWSHFWCEINVGGRYYVLDAGNKKDGLYYFVEPYETAEKYMYYDEVLKVSPEA